MADQVTITGLVLRKLESDSGTEVYSRVALWDFSYSGEQHSQSFFRSKERTMQPASQPFFKSEERTVLLISIETP
jgi:hypothetical protein